MSDVTEVDHLGFYKEHQVQLGPRTVVRRGDKVRVNGFRGTFTFLALVFPRDRRRRLWVDVYKDGHGVRSFDLARIRKG